MDEDIEEFDGDFPDMDEKKNTKSKKKKNKSGGFQSFGMSNKELFSIDLYLSIRLFRFICACF